jgi:hypothetical protein
MDYKKHYDVLIERAKSRIVQGYTENHHVIPKCIGGTDNKDNLVRLTPEEHYVAHQLLVKIYPNNSPLINAAVMMVSGRPNNKLYGWLRRRFSETQSKRQAGYGNNQYGTRWICNTELQQNRKIKKSDLLPVGWTEGRRMNFDLIFHACKVCNSQFKRLNLEIYCSETCKKHDRAESNRIIDQNLEKMIEYYQTVWSIDKTLKHFGIAGSRAGNKYFSSILKNRNIYVRKRRNSSQSIASDAPDL